MSLLKQLIAEMMTSQLDESYDSDNIIEELSEDVPTMSASAGGIAGIGIGPDGEPGVTPEQQKRHRNKTRKGKRLRDIL